MDVNSDVDIDLEKMVMVCQLIVIVVYEQA